MRFSRVLAVAAFALSGAVLCQLPSAAQPVPVPVDFSGSVDTACDQVIVTPGVLGYDGLNQFSSDPLDNGSDAVVGAFSCNTLVDVVFDGVSAAATNPIGLTGLDCAVDLAGNSIPGPLFFNGPCDTLPTQQLVADGQVFDQTTVSLNVVSVGGPLPAGFYDFTVDLSIVPN